MIKATIILIIGLSLMCCERRERRGDPTTDVIGESPSDFAAVKLSEPALDELTLKITEGYEHLRPFLQKDIPDQIFEALLGDIHRDFDKKRIAAGSKPGKWLNGSMINQGGVGLLSMFKEHDSPASVFLDYHSWKATHLDIAKPPMWDSINLKGKSFGRMFASELSVTATKNGISELRISFMIIITRGTKKEDAELEYKSGDYLYLLRGFYYMLGGVSDSSSSSWLAHYDPSEKAETIDGLTRYSGSKILSRNVFCDSGFDLSEEAKRHLLEIMDMVMIYYANTHQESVFRELMDKQPYQLFVDNETR